MPQRRLHTRTLVGALLALALAPACERARPQRLVLVTLDTLRWDSFGGRAAEELLDRELPPDYAGLLVEGDEERVTAMPRTLDWARSGAVFERYYSVSPVTQPAHASMFTGRFPWQHGVTRNGQVLDAGESTVAERLAESGYETAAVVASYPLVRRMGLNQGFARYVDELELSGINRVWNGEEVDAFYVLSERVTDRALELLDGFTGERQFLWVHYFDPHAPYGDTDPEARPRSLASLQKAVFGAKRIELARAGIAKAQRQYEADVRFLDDQLMRLLDRLATEDERFETHVVLVSDHGESFGEDDSLGHGPRLTESQLRVPLVVHSPRVRPGVHALPVGSVDVAATLLALGGLDPRVPHGRDLTREPTESELVAGMRKTFDGVLVDERVEGEPVELEGERWFLYDGGRLLTGDAAAVFLDDDEGRVATGEAAERARELFARFAREHVRAEELDDDATRAALEALGYVESEDP